MDGDKNDYSHTDEHLLEFGDPVRPTILPTTLPVDSLISHFPTETADGEQLIPRDEQISLCNDIELAIRQGYKYIIVEAPPGIGKSPVAIALCSWLENGYICTSQKSLQFQYTKKHGDRAYHVTGRNNHLCRTRMIDEQYSKDTGEEVEDIYCDNGACQGASKFKCPGKPVAVSPEDYVKKSRCI